MVKNPSKVDPDTEPRRAFIRERLEAAGKVSFREIYDAFPETARPSIHADVRAFKKLNIQVDIHGTKNERFLTTTTYLHISTKPLRELVGQVGKSAIGQVAAGMILGSSEIEYWPVGAEHEESWPTQGEILQYLREKAGATWDVSEVTERLERYWGCQQRAVCLDAGTTTEATAQRVQHLKFPRPDLTHLFLCTNSRGIFEITGRPGCQIRTIIIGGAQQKRTEAICGVMAQQCLDMWNPTFGISIIGTTVIDTRNYKLGCFSDDEGALKANMLGRGSLKVIVADHLKFQDYPMGASSPFSMICKRQVDLVISDAPFTGDASKIRAFPVPIIFAQDLAHVRRKR